MILRRSGTMKDKIGKIWPFRAVVVCWSVTFFLLIQRITVDLLLFPLTVIKKEVLLAEVAIIYFQ